jgi:NAD+ synthase (glutamine-hydrolysing)
VRILLAATTSEKGEPDANADHHVELLATASDAGCALAVFPEMSLTGSVDPVRHPDHAVDLDDPAVDRVVRATRTTGVGALFGIGERREGVDLITQIHATGGQIAGVQRKRVLGYDEEGFCLDTATERFAKGPEPFGVII